MKHRQNNKWTQRLSAARRAGLWLSVLSAAQSLFAVLSTLAMRNTINSALGGGMLLFWVFALVALSAASPLLGGIELALAQRITDRTAADLRSDMLRALRHKNCADLQRFHSGALLQQTMNDAAVVVERYTHILPDAVGQIAQLVGAIAMLTLLNPKLALVVFAVGCVIALCGRVLRTMLKARYRAAKRAGDALSANLQENLEQMELLRTTAEESELRGKLDRVHTVYLRTRAALRRLNVGGTTAFSLAIQLGVAAVIIWGAGKISGSGLPFGDLTAMIQLVLLFRAPVSGLTNLQSQMAAVDASHERIDTLYAIPDEFAGEVPQGTPRTIVLDRVTFAYEDGETPVFSDFSARIELDCWNNISGSSGRGKSTLYRLILGLYRPTSGEIYLETDCGRYPCSAATRALFGFVPQSPILFSGTIRDNLKLAAPDADDRTLWDALERAQCAFVRDLPDGLDTRLGQFGEGLSVGQRQRIVIARALLRDAPVLLLDEATASLDAETEQALLAELSAHYPAALLATHRQWALHGVPHRDLTLKERREAFDE